MELLVFLITNNRLGKFANMVSVFKNYCPGTAEERRLRRCCQVVPHDLLGAPSRDCPSDALMAVF